LRNRKFEEGSAFAEPSSFALFSAKQDLPLGPVLPLTDQTAKAILEGAKFKDILKKNYLQIYVFSIEEVL
jgi:hypothetical protein